MSDRPFMQLYVSDFVGDTLTLSAEHVGAYLLLLIAMWNADGSLPDDEVKLARVARMTVKKWKAVAVDLMPFFIVSEGRVSHGRLTKELQKSERQSESRAAAGAKGGAATALKYNAVVPANAGAMPQHLPEPYRKKERKSVLKKGGADAPADRVRLHSDNPLFHEIGRLRRAGGGMYPSTDRDGCWYFEAAEVETAKASLAAPRLPPDGPALSNGGAA